MKELTQQEIDKRYKELPEDLRGALFSEENADILMAIGKKYNLPIDKIGELSSLANHIILGAMSPQEFIPNVSKKLGLDKETAKKIAEEINSQIFSKVRESLKKLHKVEAGTEEQKDEKMEERNDTKTRQPPTKVPEIITPQSSPFDKKMSDEVFRVKKEESERKDKTQKEPSFAEMKKDIAKKVEEAKEKKKYPGEGDPYREPME